MLPSSAGLQPGVEIQNPQATEQFSNSQSCSQLFGRIWTAGKTTLNSCTTKYARDCFLGTKNFLWGSSTIRPHCRGTMIVLSGLTLATSASTLCLIKNLCEIESLDADSNAIGAGLVVLGGLFTILGTLECIAPGMVTDGPNELGEIEEEI